MRLLLLIALEGNSLLFFIVETISAMCNRAREFSHAVTSMESQAPRLAFRAPNLSDYPAKLRETNNERHGRSKATTISLIGRSIFDGQLFGLPFKSLCAFKRLRENVRKPFDIFSFLSPPPPPPRLILFLSHSSVQKYRKSIRGTKTNGARQGTNLSFENDPRARVRLWLIQDEEKKRRS